MMRLYSLPPLARQSTPTTLKSRQRPTSHQLQEGALRGASHLQTLQSLAGPRAVPGGPLYHVTQKQ